MFPSHSIDKYSNYQSKRKNKSIHTNDFCPRRFALNFQPPILILEYLIPSTKKLYHKRIKLKEFNKDTNIQKVTKQILKRYQNYLPQSKVNPCQIERLLVKLKERFLKKKQNRNQKTKNSFCSQKSLKQSQAKNNLSCKENKINHSSRILSHKKISQIIEEDLMKKSFLKKQSQVKVQEVSHSQNKNEFSEDFDEFSQYDEASLQQSKLKQQNQDQEKIHSQLEEVEEDESLEEILDDFDEIEDDESEEEIQNNQQEFENNEIQNSIHVSKIDLENENLNKLDDKQIEKLKQKMDADYQQNKVNIDDSQFIYDQRQEFNPEESNDWDDNFSELDEF